MEPGTPMGGGGAFAGLLFPLLLAIGFAIVGNVLARQKGRNVIAWTMLGLVPIINSVAIWYFVGASNLKMERKVEELLIFLRPSDSG